MQVAFRTDASRTIGSGHVARCLTLAEGLRESGARVTFIARPHPGNLNELLRSRGFEVAELGAPQPTAPRGGPAHAHWIGADWRDDACETRAAIGRLGARPDWLIVDHYGLDERWEAELRGETAALLAVDDLADRRHDCDLLLDQNLFENAATRYAGRLPERCTAMLGPRYALLQPVYAQLHERVAPRAGPVRRACIYFGTADVHGMTRMALLALLDLSVGELEIDVVADGADDAAALRACVAGRGNVRFHSRLPTLAHLLADADLAVGAAGATSWERLCLGVPSLVITLAENQRPVAAALAAKGLAQWLGHYDQVSLSGLREALARRVAAGADTMSSAAGLALVDGAGVRRVRAALMVSAQTPLIARAAAAGDEALLLEWANDPVTRRYSFDQAIIPPEQHHRWLKERLGAGRNCLLLIIETEDGVALATARFDRLGADWRINYSVAAQHRRKGLGPRVLEVALASLARTYPEAAFVWGRVMAANEPSHRVFRRLGFEVASEGGGAVEYRRAL